MFPLVTWPWLPATEVPLGNVRKASDNGRGEYFWLAKEKERETPARNYPRSNPPQIYQGSRREVEPPGDRSRYRYFDRDTRALRRMSI